MMSIIITNLLEQNFWALIGFNIIMGVAAYMFYRAYAETAQTARRLDAMSAKTRKPLLAIKDFVDAQVFPTLILNENDIITHINQAMAETFNHNSTAQHRTSLREQHVSSLIRSPHILSVYEQVKISRKSKQFKFEHTDNVSRQFWLNISPIKVTPLITYYCFTFRDLTKDQKVERMRADFVANASHELRTPLASISGFIETLQGAAKDDADNRERFLSIMQQQAARMTRLIDDLLSLSKIEMDLHIKPQDEVDLYEIAKQSLVSFEPLAQDKKVELVFDAQIDKALMKGDQDQLEQLLGNLLNNAFKYGLSDRLQHNKIILRLAKNEAQNEINLSIVDFGQGIPNTDLPRLTERFYRISSAHKVSGTGLGLAIVKHIVQRHDGKLSFHSQIDMGTEVKISFVGK